MGVQVNDKTSRFWDGWNEAICRKASERALDVVCPAPREHRLRVYDLAPALKHYRNCRSFQLVSLHLNRRMVTGVVSTRPHAADKRRLKND